MIEKITKRKKVSSPFSKNSKKRPAEEPTGHLFYALYTKTDY